jgi:DNA helicase HerA-like ATPase
MRPNPALDVAAAITELGVGEALVSMLDAKGRPGVTERVWMLAPGSRIGPATDAERQAIRAGSMLAGKYEKTIDRESAYEVLLKRTEATAAAAGGQANQPAGGAGVADQAGSGAMGVVSDFLFGSTGPRGGRRDGVVQSVFKSVARRTATQLVRGVLGSLTGRR